MGPEATAWGDETASYPTDTLGARQHVPRLSAYLYIEGLYNRPGLQDTQIARASWPDKVGKPTA